MLQSDATEKEDGNTHFMTTVNLISSGPFAAGMTIKDVALQQICTITADCMCPEHIVEDILADIFAERRGYFPETSSSCDVPQFDKLAESAEQHVDKRLRYWQDMLETRRAMQLRIELKTGKSPEQVLFNRRSTLDNRDKEMVRRIMDYAERVKPAERINKPIGALVERIDPCSCNVLEAINETLPRAEAYGEKNVEVVGLPAVIRQELLGESAAARELQHNWQKSTVLDERIKEHFQNICDVVEFMPDLEKLQVTGVSVAKLQVQPSTQLLEEQDMLKLTTSTTERLCEEEQLMFNEFSTDQQAQLSEREPEPEPPELGLQVNGKIFIVDDNPITECLDILIKFKSDPYQRRLEHILHLKNIGKQTLSFRWIQDVFYYNRGSLLLANDNEFLFDTKSFRLAHNQIMDLVCLYQPRKVAVAVEMWRLMVDPCIFCASNESIRLRFHGQCTPPTAYINKLKELRCGSINRANETVMDQLTTHLADLVPLVEPPPACCPYDRTLYEREEFNSLNPGFNCKRFDDLEALKAFHIRIKKPRERPWDLRIETLKDIIMAKNVVERKDLFPQLTMLLEPLAGPAANLEISTQLNQQQQRTRFIYVRGVICNGIEEWEDLMIIIEESFCKSQCQLQYTGQMDEVVDDQDGDEVLEQRAGTLQPKILDKIELLADVDINPMEEDHSWIDLEDTSASRKKVRHSKYLHDSIYIQTYAHLCNIAETIVSVIESTNLVAE